MEVCHVGWIATVVSVHGLFNSIFNSALVRNRNVVKAQLLVNTVNQGGDEFVDLNRQVIISILKSGQNSVDGTHI